MDTVLLVVLVSMVQATEVRRVASSRGLNGVSACRHITSPPLLFPARSARVASACSPPLHFRGSEVKSKIYLRLEEQTRGREKENIEFMLKFEQNVIL